VQQYPPGLMHSSAQGHKQCAGCSVSGKINHRSGYHFCRVPTALAVVISSRLDVLFIRPLHNHLYSQANFRDKTGNDNCRIMIATTMALPNPVPLVLRPDDSLKPPIL